MTVSFREWQDSAGWRQTAASLGSEEVQVWLASIPSDEAQLGKFAHLLSPAERAHAERFRVTQPRRQFVFGRAVLRQLLGACLNVEPASLAFGCGPRGKPCLDPSFSAGDLRFNLSHSHSRVAIALALGRDVGVDLEWIHIPTDWQLLAERIFSPRELRELHSLPAAQQRTAFFNGWTRKEAYLKATGEGLTDALSSIEVTLAPGKEPELLRWPSGSESTRPWVIRVIPLPSDFAGAVVFEKSSANH